MSNRNFQIHDGERTATSNTGAIRATSETIALAFDVTTIEGTSATLDITVEWSPDGTNFGDAATPDAIAQITAEGVYQGIFSVKAAYYRVVYTMGGDVTEVQAVTHDHDSGTFTLSFDGQGPTADLDWDAPVASVAAEGTLTVDTKPSAVTAARGTLTIDTKPIDEVAAQGTLSITEPVSPGVKSQGTLTIAEPVSEGDEFTLDATVYTLLDIPLAAYDIAIGADEAATKVNIVAAINASGTPGTEYFAGTLIHPTVVATTFAGDACVLTANEFGTAGNAIATTETGQGFTHVSNIFNDTTLGATTTGVQPDTFTLDTQVYRLMDTPAQAYDVEIGADEATSKLNIVAAVNAAGTEGIEYYAGTDQHPTVSAGIFTGDDSVLTARTKGLAGNSIATTETFADAGNTIDDTTLGATTTATADTLTIDSKVYTFQAVLTDVDGHVFIGADVEASQLNLVAAINRTTGYGTQYADATQQHSTVSIAAFASDDAILTAKTPGAAGDALATTETFDEGTNVFDATTLGAVTTGIDADTVTLDTTDYTFVDVDNDVTGEVFIGATLATAQDNLVTAVADHTTVTMAAFASDDAVVTAVTAGTPGNAIVSTETFTAGTNVFDATTLGATTLGVNGVKTELELLSNITTVSVLRNGAGDWDVTFPSSMGNVATMTIDDTNLTGGSTSGVAESTEGVDATTTFLGVGTHFDS
jgi:hypothetical protein